MPPTQPPRVLIAADTIAARIRELAGQIDADYPPDSRVHMICVLKGGFIFLADLVRHMKQRVTLDFIAVSSYDKGTTSSGEVRFLKDVDEPLDGKDVIIVEDIVDTGLTLSYLHGVLRARNPRSLRTACLLSKPSRRKIEVQVEYIGFTIDDLFVVGYGLDFEHKYRSLADICVL